MPIVRLDNFQAFQAINVLSDPGHIGGPVVIPNAVKVMPLWLLSNGKLTRSVLGGVVGSFTSASATVAESIRAAIVANSQFGPLLSHIAPTASFVGIDLQDIRQPRLPVFRSTGAAVPGTGTGVELPGEVALVLTIRTNQTGSGARGRMYQQGFDTASLATGGVAAAAVVTALQNYANAIIAGMAAGGLTWGLLQPARAAYTGSTGTAHPARPAAIASPVVTLVRDNHWDSQRRRGLK